MDPRERKLGKQSNSQAVIVMSPNDVDATFFKAQRRVTAGKNGQQKRIRWNAGEGLVYILVRWCADQKPAWSVRHWSVYPILPSPWMLRPQDWLT